MPEGKRESREAGISSRREGSARLTPADTSSGQRHAASSQHPKTDKFIEQGQLVERLMRQNDDLQAELNARKQSVPVYDALIRALQKEDGDTDGLELL